MWSIHFEFYVSSTIILIIVDFFGGVEIRHFHQRRYNNKLQENIHEFILKESIKSSIKTTDDYFRSYYPFKNEIDKKDESIFKLNLEEIETEALLQKIQEQLYDD